MKTENRIILSQQLHDIDAFHRFEAQKLVREIRRLKHLRIIKKSNGAV